MAAIVRTLGRSGLLKQQHNVLQSKQVMASTAYDEMKGFWDKNRKLNRPMSPFLFAYKPHLAMSTSLAHRITGVAMSTVITGGSIILLVLPGDFTHYLQMVQSLGMGPILAGGLKFLIAWPISYHFINGIRHLAWDAGQGFALKTLYQTAYFAIALSFIVACAFVFLY